MSILGAVIVPHPPLIIPTVGNGREEEVQITIDAYRAAAKQVAAWEPEVLIVTSPHQIMYADYFHISPGRGAAGVRSALAGPTRVSACPDSLRWTTTGWDSVSPRLWRTWAAVRCSLPVVTCPIS